MAGMAGELALQFYAKMVGLKARILLPSLDPQPIDHVIEVDSQNLRVQSKTSVVPPGFSVNTIYGRFKFPIGAPDAMIDYFSYALIATQELYDDGDYMTVHLFAFVPVNFVRTHAVVAKVDRYITYEALQAASESFSHVDLDQHCTLPAMITIADDTYAALTSQHVDGRLLEALDVIGSPIDASRALDMVMANPGLRKALATADRNRHITGSVNDPASHLSNDSARRALHSVS